MITVKRIFSISILILVVIIFCGCRGIHCETPGENNLGLISPLDSSYTWFPTRDSFVLSNTNGYEAVLKKGQRSTYSYQYNERAIHRDDQCPIYESYTLTNVSLMEKSNVLSYYIEYELCKNIDKLDVYAPDFQPEKVQDYLSIRVNNYYWTIYLSPDSLKNILLADTLTLGGIKYEDVFCLKRKNVTNGISPTILFYKKGIGVLGFDLNNEEQWFIKP